MIQELTVREIGGAKAIILHRDHRTVFSLIRQLSAIGLTVSNRWPDLDADALTTDFIFFDADLGYDAQFPWGMNNPPMPMIALIGSEAPSRIEWALRVGAHAQLIKPVGDSGVYSALLAAQASYDSRHAFISELRSLRHNLSEQKTVVRAVNYLMTAGSNETVAYDGLKQLATNWKVSFEEAAQRVVASTASKGISDGRNGSHR